jgi:hypothetical protein
MLCEGNFKRRKITVFNQYSLTDNELIAEQHAPKVAIANGGDI